ncbi:MAG TPA: xanthine dehydrogenase family protein subunit M [Candidatus Nanopelagicaceae bacterium]|nr:xanthine dehydrogenase family protein subunit M [Candidatus Nanopelagicaceae bacterium]
MYPSRFSYEAPKTIEEAISLLQSGGGEAKVLAGGQSLVPMLKLRFASPEMLVDINNIPGLRYHRVDPDGSIRIGALCRHEDLEGSDVLARHQPTMAAAAPLVADPIVRTRGTFVGSICHADPQGDWAATLIALDGHIIAQGPNGRRTIKARDFVSGPFQTVLNYDEIAIEAVIPAPTGVPFGGYLKLERRIGDFATAAVAVALEMSGANVIRAGIALVGVGGHTINASESADSLVGGHLTEERIAKAAELAAAAAQPRSDHRGSASYKKHIVSTFVSRILNNIAKSTEKAA